MCCISSSSLDNLQFRDLCCPVTTTKKFRLKRANPKRLPTVIVAKTSLVPKRGLAKVTSKRVLRAVRGGCGATNLEVNRLDAATPILDGRLAVLFNACVEYLHMTSVELQVTTLRNPTFKPAEGCYNGLLLVWQLSFATFA